MPVRPVPLVDWLGAHQGGHHRGAGGIGRLRCHRLAQLVQAVADRLAAALDQAVGVKTQQRARADL